MTSRSGSAAAELTYTRHAREQMEERQIDQSWVERVVTNPTQRTGDRGDSSADRFFAHIAERGDRVLPVVVNTSSDPSRVVAVFFDRRMRGEL